MSAAQRLEADLPPPDSDATHTPSTAQEEAEVDSGGRGAKRIQYTNAMDLFLVKAVSAARAHVAGYGDKQTRFDQVARDCRNEPCFASAKNEVTRKSVSDRYRKLVSAFKKEDQRCAAKSGADNEEVTALREILADLLEAETDAKQRRDAEKEKKRETSEKLLVAGEAMRAASLKRFKRRKVRSEDDSDGRSG